MRPSSSYPDGRIDTPSEAETLRDVDPAAFAEVPPTLDALDELLYLALELLLVRVRVALGKTP